MWKAWFIYHRGSTATVTTNCVIHGYQTWLSNTIQHSSGTAAVTSDHHSILPPTTINATINTTRQLLVTATARANERRGRMAGYRENNNNFSRRSAVNFSLTSSQPIVGGGNFPVSLATATTTLLLRVIYRYTYKVYDTTTTALLLLLLV